MSLRETSVSALRALRKPGSFELTEELFLRLLGLIYIAAFASWWPQIVGLSGSDGIQPAAQLLNAMRTELGQAALYQLPTLFWFRISDALLVACCIAGCVAGLLLLVGIL